MLFNISGYDVSLLIDLEKLPADEAEKGKHCVFALSFDLAN